jgi:hypothetical protein
MSTTTAGGRFELVRESSGLRHYLAGLAGPRRRRARTPAPERRLGRRPLRVVLPGGHPAALVRGDRRRRPGLVRDPRGGPDAVAERPMTIDLVPICSRNLIRTLLDASDR